MVKKTSVILSVAVFGFILFTFQKIRVQK
jgi:hypothetical protein